MSSDRSKAIWSEFHRLWSNTSGPGYKKSQWMDIDQHLRKMQEKGDLRAQEFALAEAHILYRKQMGCRDLIDALLHQSESKDLTVITSALTHAQRCIVCRDKLRDMPEHAYQTMMPLVSAYVHDLKTLSGVISNERFEELLREASNKGERN